MNNIREAAAKVVAAKAMVEEATREYAKALNDLDLVERVKTVLSMAYEDGEISQYPVQAFNTRNTMGDRMVTIYEDDDVMIDWAPDYEYVEIFGLTGEQFNKLMEDEDVVY